jgi:uncharacterized protein
LGIVPVIYMFGPAVAAVALSFLRHEGLSALVGGLAPGRWWIIGWGLPFVLTAACILIALPFPGVELVGLDEGIRSRLTPGAAVENRLLEYSIAQVLLLATVAGIIPNAIIAAGEEIGWRGYLWQRLNRSGFWTAALLIGCFWGIWHWPLIFIGLNYPEHPVFGIFQMVVFTTVLSPLACWLRARSRSVIPVCIFHGTFNAVAPLSFYTLTGHEMLVGLNGLAGLLTIGLFVVALYIFDESLSSK